MRSLALNTIIIIINFALISAVRQAEDIPVKNTLKLFRKPIPSNMILELVTKRSVVLLLWSSRAPLSILNSLRPSVPEQKRQKHIKTKRLFHRLLKIFTTSQ